jgi:hypothetical protein
MLRAMRSFLKENDMMAHFAMMAVRLIELHRVLKPAGSLYLHCDPTTSPYLQSLAGQRLRSFPERENLGTDDCSQQRLFGVRGDYGHNIFLYQGI